MAKVLYLLQDPNFFAGENRVGGHIAHVVGVAEAFQRMGHEIIIASFERVPYWHDPNVRYMFLKETAYRGIRRDWVRQWKVTKQIIRGIDRERPDILYVRWTMNLFFSRVRESFPELPIVLECNTPVEMAWQMLRVGRLRRWIAWRADMGYLRSATVISAVSEETKDFLLSRHPTLDPQRVIVNPNGVDVRRFRPMGSDLRVRLGIPSDAVVIGYAGNFQPWHRIDLLIRAFHELRTQGSYLLIMGAGPPGLERELRVLAAEKDSSHILFTGAVPFDQMPAYLSACDILVSPQSSTLNGRFHQSPIKLYEYMAVGRAIVATRIGQIAQVIEDGRNGLLFEPESREELECALRRLIEDRELRERLGQAARRDAELKHSWDANVSRIMDALRSSGCRIAPQ